MRKFILIKSGYDRIPQECANDIYMYLTHDEQKEVNRFMDVGKFDLPYALEIIYLTVSQRRRMNPRFIKGLESYNKKNSDSFLTVTTIPDEVTHINVEEDESGEVLTVYRPQDKYLASDTEKIELWINQISYTQELKTQRDIEERKDEINKQFRNNKSKLSLKKTILSYRNRLRRWIYSLTHKKQQRRKK